MPGFSLAHPTTKASRGSVIARKEVLCVNNSKLIDGKPCKLVFRRYIRKNGKIIYPKHAKAFPIWVPE
jgi:hypothetical protein